MKRSALALAAAIGLVPALPAAGVRFEDVTAASGLVYLQHAAREAPDCGLDVHQGEQVLEGLFCEADRLSGGAAAGDFDGDGDLDLYATRLDAPDLLFCNRLVETGAAVFEDCTAAAGLAGFDLRTNGAAWVDLENDGDLDLFVTGLGETRHFLFVNDGCGRFDEQAEARGAALANPHDHAGTSVAVGDYDQDGYPDLHVTEWRPSFAAAEGAPSNARLLRNRGAAAPGSFQDVTDAAGVSLVGIHPGGVWGFASAFADLDADGLQDLAVVSDFGSSRLFWNRGDGTFEDGTAAANVATDENGMGSTFGDYDGDGDPDWFVTSIWDPAETCEIEDCGWGYTGNRLYRNLGGRTFEDATGSAETGVRNGHWGWGAAFFDADNDADLDLVMTNGIRLAEHELDAPFENDPMRYWENDGAGGFVERSADVGLLDTASGKGLLTFDYDADGDLDLFLVNNAGAPRLYRNDGGNEGDWLRVELEGTLSNREGLGAQIRVYDLWDRPPQVREMGSATHFLAQSERVAHFGLPPGDAPVALVRITWPGRGHQFLLDVPRNAVLRVREPDGSFWIDCGVLGPELLALLPAAALLGRGVRRRRPD